MGRAPRVDVGNEIYHVLNRANNRMTIFEKDKDYEAFESILKEAKDKNSMQILCYCLMPNHWHFILRPRNNGDLNKFMQWLTLTHTQRWHAHYKSVGYGHLYQGRYRSFLIQKDEHFLQVANYVERNALRAGLVKRAEDWEWSSLWIRERGSLRQKELVDCWPVPIPKNYLEYVNRPESKNTLESIRDSIVKNRPFGESSWVTNMVNKFELEITLRQPGRPRNELKKVSGTMQKGT